MNLPAAKRFLGVDDPADDHALLGVTGGRTDPRLIEEALRRRLSEIDDHPAADSRDAAAVRKRVRDAAARLAAALRNVISEPAKPGTVEATLNPRRPKTPPPSLPREGNGRTARPASPKPGITLTSFDQQVLAVLVGCGGWNAVARAKLVAVAGFYGVTVQGLLKVVTGLGAYARSGGPALALRDITAGRDRIASPEQTMPIRSQPTVSSVLVQKLGDRLTDEQPWARAKLAIMFAVLTVLIGVLALRLVFFGSTNDDRDEGTQASSFVDTPVPDPGTTQRRQPTSDRDRHLLQFNDVPTFLGNALPKVATDAADEGRVLWEELDALSRQLTVSAEGSEAVRRKWQAIIRSVSTGWVLMDDSTRVGIHSAVLDVLYASSDSPEVSDRLLDELTPPSGSPVEPVDVWRGPWLAGTLASVARHPAMPPVVVERARSQVEVSLGVSADLDFTAAAGIWLDRVVVDLIETTEFSDRAMDEWELWLAAQRALGTGPRYDAALVRVIREFMATRTDLSRPGPSINVIGRILLTLDFTDSATVRMSVRSLFEDDRIGSNDLWVLTSLMSIHDRTSWFDAELVLPYDADDRMRRRIGDRIDQRWAAIGRQEVDPALAPGRGISVDAVGLDRLRSVLAALEQLPEPRDDKERLLRLRLGTRVNLAAALLTTQRTVDADAEFDTIEQFLHSTAPPAPIALPRAGQSVGADGAFRDSYDQVRRNADDKLRLLRALRNSSGTDLGPLDAATLVEEAYRGSPNEVRSVARAVVLDSFRSGPNVALELVDQFPGRARTDALSDFISELTTWTLPAARSPGWRLEARAALLDHALSLRRSAATELDLIIADISSVYLLQLQTLAGEDRDQQRLTPPQVVDELLKYWLMRASSVMVARPVPDDLSGLDQRHRTRMRLAEGPVQVLVARQLAILDLVSYVTVAEQPVLASLVSKRLSESLDRRNGLGHVLEQAIEIETAITRVWAMRLTGVVEEGGGG